MSGLYAVRAAARLRRELKIPVEMVKGHYAEYRVLVDGEVVVDGGALVALGIAPSSGKIVDAVRARLATIGS